MFLKFNCKLYRPLSHFYLKKQSQKRSFSFLPSDLLVDALTMIHNSGPFPWGYSIVMATLLFRGCLTLPLAVLQRRNQERMELVRPLSKAWAKTLEKAPLKSAVSVKAGELTLQKKAAQARLGQRIRYLHQQLSCSSIRNIWLPLLQIPLFISMTAAIRQLLGVQFLWIEASGEPMNGMRDEGFAWFPDLVASDPTLITPIICGLCYLFNSESAAANRRDGLKKQTSAILRGKFFKY